ncbi:MAG: hypothetical protein HGA22_06530 [Clostridiales bacterium]|nr:hypothetical protein [Clostridiales bacterium]
MLKNKRLSRVFSMILSVCMLLTMFMATAFAADTTTTSTDTAGSSSAAAAAPAGAPGGAPPGGTGGMSIAALDESDSSVNFKDLNSSTAWANSYIDKLFESGIVKGTANGVYSPNSSIKRGDFALMLYRKYNYATEGFSYGDVGTDAYYYQAVMRGKATGIFEDTKYFNPDKAVTREQAAIWMYKSELNKGMPADLASSDLSSYKDAASISEAAKTAVATLTSFGVFKGNDSGNFNPAANLTRAEMAVVFYRLSQLGGGGGTPPGGTTSTAGGAPAAPPGGGGSATVDHGTYATLVEADSTDKTYVSTGDKENAVRVEGKKVTLTNATINKTAGAAGTGDTSNFYGVNAGLLALDKAEVTINKAAVNTSVTGGNGIFSYGTGTKVTVNNATIRTTQNSSGGIMVTGGGTMYVNDCDIDTKGGSSAALRTDRGGGTLVVDGGKYVSNGNGSPAIYCTAAISASNATLTATTSEAVVVEGKNSVALKNCIVSGKMIKDNVENLQNIMIYQSMSGDADTGTSSFTMEGGSLTANNGDMIYVTNTSCIVKFTDVKITPFNDVFLKVVGNDARNGWGVVGKNGGKCVFTADNQDITGNIIVDKISSLDISLTNGSSINGTINTANSGGTINVTIDATSKWTLTADAYVSKLSGTTANIVPNGFKVYVNGTVAVK